MGMEFAKSIKAGDVQVREDNSAAPQADDDDEDNIPF